MTCAPSEDSDQPGHLPSVIRVFAVCSMGSQGPKVPSSGQLELWLDWADAQADLSLSWVHRSFCWICCAVAHMSWRCIAVTCLHEFRIIWAGAWQNQQNGMCTQWRLRSAWASAQADLSLRCPPEESLGPYLPIQNTAKTLISLGTHSKDSDQTGRLPRLIWVFAGHTWFGLFHHAID